MTGKIIVRKDEGIARITFDHPTRYNAMTRSMIAEMHDALRDFDSDRAIRVLVLAGTGEKAFNSGADISELDKSRDTPELLAEQTALVHKTFNKLSTMRVPVVAKIRGWCMGGGLGMALNCDLRICSTDAKFGTPAARLGIGYSTSALKTMTDIVGYAAAREILFTGMQYTAEEAARMGLVHRVTTPENLDSFCEEYLARIVDNAPLTVWASKLVISELAKNPEEQDLEKCRQAVATCESSDDFVEGRRAFMEKRKPLFTGH